MKKQLIILFSMMVLMIGLVGCGQKSKDASGSNATMSKGDWIGMLGEGFGYNAPLAEENFYSDVTADNENFNQIQACAEWGVITEQGVFSPEDTATWEYVLKTAVRAVGIDNLNSAGIEVTEDSLVEFFANNIANIGDVDMGASVTVAEAEQIVVYTLDYSRNLTPLERYEYTYNEGVYEVTTADVLLCGDGATAWVLNGATYQNGDILYIAPSETTVATAIKVISCDGENLVYENASTEDVYSELYISGKYEGTIISVESAEDITASYQNSVNGVLRCVARRGVQRNGNGVTFSKGLGGGGEISVTIKDISVVPDIDYRGIFGGLVKADATVSFKDEIVASYTSEHYSQTIQLGSVTIQLASTPCNLELSLALNVGADGEMSLTYTSEIVGEIGYKKGCGLSKSITNQNPTFDFHADATVTVEPSLKLDLKLITESIANVKVTTGVVAIANVDVDLLGNQPACLDIYLYVPLRWGVNEDGCIMTNISSKLKYSATIWDSTNSPITKRFHWEDDVLVDACTRGKEAVIETPVTDEEGLPYDEYKIFEFEVIDFEVIRLYASKVYVEAGESMTVGFESIPGGYSAADLVYSVDDSSVCTISGGVINGVASGSATVKVSTPDGKYSVYFTVTVKGDFNDTTDFEPL